MRKAASAAACWVESHGLYELAIFNGGGCGLCRRLGCGATRLSMIGAGFCTWVSTSGLAWAAEPR